MLFNCSDANNLLCYVRLSHWRDTYTGTTHQQHFSRLSSYRSIK